MNTFTAGKVKVLVYRDNTAGVWYASALEFNLTISGDDKATVWLELDQAISDYIASAREIGDTALLNQEPDPELVNLWEAGLANQPTSIKSPYTAHFAGSQSISHVQ